MFLRSVALTCILMKVILKYKHCKYYLLHLLQKIWNWCRGYHFKSFTSQKSCPPLVFITIIEYQYLQYSDAKIAALEKSQPCLYMYKGRLDQPDFKLHSQMQSLLIKCRNELLYQENYIQNYATTHHQGCYCFIRSIYCLIKFCSIRF